MIVWRAVDVVSSCVGVCVEGASCFDIRHTWVLDGGREATVFISFFLFTKNCDLVHGLGPVHVLGHGHGPVLGVVVWVDFGWRFGWTCGAPRDDQSINQSINLYLNTVRSIRNLKIKNNLTILNKIQNLTTTNLTKTCFS